MELYIKNMVCPRCIAAIENILNDQNIAYKQVELGHVALKTPIPADQLANFELALNQQGFELLDDKKKQMVEQVKNLIIQEVYHPSPDLLKRNLSDIISENLHHEYKYISTLFSEITGTTIEKFQIKHKIERTKELLVYDQLSLKEISYLLGYSSEAYLSNQFKKVTGYSPSHFKKIGQKKRIAIDKI